MNLQRAIPEDPPEPSMISISSSACVQLEVAAIGTAPPELLMLEGSRGSYGSASEHLGWGSADLLLLTPLSIGDHSRLDLIEPLMLRIRFPQVKLWGLGHLKEPSKAVSGRGKTGKHSRMIFWHRAWMMMLRLLNLLVLHLC